MRSNDVRLELRLPANDKSAVERAAQERGISVSALIRSALRSHLKRPHSLSPDDAYAVASLRRRINSIEARNGRTDDLAQARADAQKLLGR
ncbi:CopG family transcriptional regulator [Devosia sp.]|uniref:ribbon-helix-helix domain-containing protein n=1 Tax=Devosia sp. TaxID=1871048 RepID=UPI001ACBF5CF|nr:CopG family transcriptional regulator [Devosia sp.]MBN9334511.1 ribbon-helix-helix protein, CopG family [Devosia sp.]